LIKVFEKCIWRRALLVKFLAVMLTTLLEVLSFSAVFRDINKKVFIFIIQGTDFQALLSDNLRLNFRDIEKNFFMAII